MSIRLLIVDDHSIDNTKQKIREYQKKWQNIRYLVNKRKKGPAGARNHGILNAQGEYIAFLDSDDQWLDNHLEDSINILENNKNILKICYSFWYYNNGGKLLNLYERLTRSSSN